MKKLLALVFLPVSAFAQYDLTYTGALMTGTETVGGVTSSISGSWSGDLILDAPLAANLNNAAVSPLSLLFVGNGMVSELSQLGPVYFSTDAQGQITAWSMTMNDNAGGPAAFGSTFSSAGIDAYQMNGVCDYSTYSPCSIAMQSSQSGAWFADPPG